MRLLVDIAERSLSESAFQDPTTAVQAIDRLHDILRHLARRPFEAMRSGEDGEIRLLVKTMTWENYVHLAFDEIRMAGAGSPQVSRRLVAALTISVTSRFRSASSARRAGCAAPCRDDSGHVRRAGRPLRADPDREGLRLPRLSSRET